MKSIQEASRKPNYFKDIEFGKTGENDFEEYITEKINKKGYTLFDVRNDKDYQKCDIDYIIDKNGGYELPAIGTVLEGKNYVRIEVKLDSRATYTQNIPYELVSHNNSGWCVVTKCDFVYMVLTEKDSSNIVRRLWINMKKWHKFCADRSNKKEINVIKNENIVDLLCRISDLENNEVITDVVKSN